MRAITWARRGLSGVVKDHSAFIGSTVSLRTTADEIVLTFDDGPAPPVTEQVADVLAEFGATATFFVLMTRVPDNASILRALVAGGHEVALHGLDHRRLTGRSYSSLLEDLRRGKEELEDLSGTPVRWFRPPYGAQGLRSWSAVRAAGLEPVMWNRSTRDSADLPEATRLSSATLDAARGDIVLAHDGFASLQDNVDDGPAPDIDRPRFIRKILDHYERLGLSACSLGDALHSGTPVRRAWFSTAL